MDKKMQRLIEELVSYSKSLNSFEQAVNKVGDVPDKNGINLSESVNWFTLKVAETSNEIAEIYEDALILSML